MRTWVSVLAISLAALLALSGCARHRPAPRTASVPPAPPAPRPEVCGNCVDDDGDGAVDWADADCCAHPVELRIDRVRVRSAKPDAPSEVKLGTALAGAGVGEANPLIDDVGLQLRCDGGKPLCLTVGHEQWTRQEGKYRFQDPTRRRARGLAAAVVGVRPDGTVAVRIDDLELPIEGCKPGDLVATVRVGNHCATRSVTLRAGERGELRFP